MQTTQAQPGCQDLEGLDLTLGIGSFAHRETMKFSFFLGGVNPTGTAVAGL